jgi:hypothetical protein
MTKVAGMVAKKLSKVKKGPSAYNLFVKEQTPLVKKNDPQISFADLSKYISKNWKELGEDEKIPYQQEAEDLKTSK